LGEIEDLHHTEDSEDGPSFVVLDSEIPNQISESVTVNHRTESEIPWASSINALQEPLEYAIADSTSRFKEAELSSDESFKVLTTSPHLSVKQIDSQHLESNTSRNVSDLESSSSNKHSGRSLPIEQPSLSTLESDFSLVAEHLHTPEDAGGENEDIDSKNTVDTIDSSELSSPVSSTFNCNLTVTANQALASYKTLNELSDHTRVADPVLGMQMREVDRSESFEVIEQQSHSTIDQQFGLIDENLHSPARGVESDQNLIANTSIQHAQTEQEPSLTFSSAFDCELTILQNPAATSCKVICTDESLVPDVEFQALNLGKLTECFVSFAERVNLPGIGIDCQAIHESHREVQAINGVVVTAETEPKHFLPGSSRIRKGFFVFL